jgi:hypothetical protein
MSRIRSRSIDEYFSVEFALAVHDFYNDTLHSCFEVFISQVYTRVNARVTDVFFGMTHL